jgi:hypothetical protein
VGLIGAKKLYGLRFEFSEVLIENKTLNQWRG